MIKQAIDTDHPHAGLQLAQEISAPDTRPVEAMQNWAKGEIDRLDISLDSENYSYLADAINDILEDHGERQTYFRFIFHHCMNKGKELESRSHQEATVDNNEPVFPVKHVGWRE